MIQNSMNKYIIAKKNYIMENNLLTFIKRKRLSKLREKMYNKPKRKVAQCNNNTKLSTEIINRFKFNESSIINYIFKV